ncbi:hypothetical protein BC936DRAFT_143763 [Jimgerdemannia flammicorona]|uniref:Uncharacterized protein n=1 Tax=Jimgerdemannia flammicorona TaxID=994334 RepID=A0A433DDJ0_9FUNG|nr:hypothetical protein BC936DRAFT_143763 [Jimgerdemannia flammicorona]
MPRKPQHKDKALAVLRAHALKLIHARNSYALSAFLICPPFNHPAKHLIDAPDPHGDTLVHFAARAHDVAALRILVTEFGGDARAVNEHGRQPIHEAIDSADCVRFLVTECGVDINAMKRGDWTPLMIAGTSFFPSHDARKINRF